jgi:hypothetical protein
MEWEVVRNLYGNGALYDYIKDKVNSDNVNVFRCQDFYGKYLIHYACQNHDEKALRFLLVHGAQVDSQDRIGRTPLMHAVDAENIRCMRILLSVGCNPRLPVHTISEKQITAYQRSVILIRNDMDSSTLRLFIANGMRIMKHIPPYHEFIESDVYEYEERVKECIRRIIILMSLKRRRIHSMVHLDRFLIRQLALALWTERYKFD